MVNFTEVVVKSKANFQLNQLNYMRKPDDNPYTMEVKTDVATLVK